MENLNNENKFYELLKTMFSSKIHASIINVNLGTLDDVLLCIDECEKIDVENSQNKIKSLLLNWKEKNYSSLDRYIEVFHPSKQPLNYFYFFQESSKLLEFHS
jgi:hypothetical protein